MIDKIFKAALALFTTSEVTTLESSALFPGADHEPLQVPVYKPTPCSIATNFDSFVDISYDIYSQNIVLLATVKFNQYLSLGYGSSMRSTNMIVWQSYEDSPSADDQIDVWSTVNHRPPTQENVYRTSVITNTADGTNTFTSLRALSVTGNGTYYDIPLDTDIKMVYAFNFNGTLSNHHENYGFFNMRLDSQTGDCTRLYTQQRVMSMHGWLMWFSWTVIAMAQIILNRYNKHRWQYQQALHNGLGLLAGVMTIVGFITIMISKNWHMSFHEIRHSSFGIISTALCLMLIIGGMFAWLKRSRANEWNTNQMLRAKRIHMYFGYFMFLWVQTAVCSGIMVRVLSLNAQVGLHKGPWLIVANLLFIIITMGVYEFLHRSFISKDYEYIVKKNTPNFSPADFNEQLLVGKKLVVLDDLVLDMTKYIDYHPGGKFVLNVNNGRDISKFFYGGYALEGNDGNTPAEGYNHSNYAKMIVDSLIVGRYQSETEPQTVLCRVNQAKTHMWNQNTGTVFFESDKPVFKNFHEGLSMCGKHFKIRSLLNQDVHRHYTICNAMQPDVYNALVECLKAGNASTFAKDKFLKENKQNFVTSTIKNYNQRKGFSFRPFDKVMMQDFELQGPIGRSLDPIISGTNIAFAAGTGILSFMDLVAAIARHNLGIGEPLKLGKNFRFILHASFQKRSDSLGMELCETLNQFCANKGLDNFVFIHRLSEEMINVKRWNDSTIAKTIKSARAQKIWVCGPPTMSEVFEKYLYNNNDTSVQFDIL